MTRLPLVVSEALSGQGPPGLPLRVGELSFGSSLLSLVHGGTADTFGVEVRFEGRGWGFIRAEIGRDPSTSLKLPGQWVRNGVSDLNGRSELRWDSKRRLALDSDGNPMPELSFSGIHAQENGVLRWSQRASPGPTVFHLTAARGLAGEDFTANQPQLVNFVGMSGQHTRAVLGAFKTHQRDAMIEAVCASSAAVLDMDVRVTEVGQGAVQGTVAEARPVGRSTWLPLTELGTGLAHTLPVLTQHAAVQCAEAGDPVPSLLACEEPEAHLHPRAAALLADVIIDTALQGRSQCLVETHAETFVLRVRRRVAEGRLRPDQVALYWVDDEGEPTRLRRLAIDAQGEVEGWPDGWFDAALDETRAILKAQEAR